MSDFSNRLTDLINNIGVAKVLVNANDSLLKDSFKKALGTSLSTDQIRNAAQTIISAQKHGLDPYDLMAVIDHESSFETDPGGNGGGVAQFLQTTAQGYNTTQAELRRDPTKSLDLAAQLLQDNLKAVGGDPAKAVAAYFIGAGTVNEASKQPGDWIDNANKIAHDRYGQTATAVSDYLTTTGKVNVSSYNREKAFGGNGGATKTGALTSTQPDTTTVDPNNFWRDATTGYPVPAGTPGAIWDQSGYEDTVAKHKANQRSGLTDIGTYMQNLIGSLSAQVAAKNLSLDEASKEFTKRLDVLKTGNEALATFAPTGDPVGAKYRQGREPGGLWSTIGAHPLAPMPTSGITYNPMQAALDLTKGIPDYQSIGSVDTSQLQQATAAMGPPPPPPPPEPAPSAGGGGAALQAAGGAVASSGGRFGAALNLLRSINGPEGSLPPDWWAQQNQPPDPAYGKGY